MSQDDKKQKKAVSDAFKNMNKNCKLWIKVQLDEIDEKIKDVREEVKKLNPEEGWKTGLTKEELDAVNNANSEMRALIDRVKSLE